jgi:regulator of protease activity HflC (stomatin/prohibitin superfamily)
MEQQITYTLILTGAIFLLIVLSSAIRILREYDRGVVFRLGRLIAVKGPGLILLIPLIDKMVKVSLRTVVMDVPTQDVITKDNVSIKVNAVVYFRVMQPDKAIVEVENFLVATSQLSQTTLRSILGQSELDELLSQRDKINRELAIIIDQQTEPWGIKVSNVEVKHVDLPQEMQRAMAKQAEAERERRAKVIHAEGEFQASQRLADAATIISANPAALQLRFLQTLTEISSEQSSTIIFPVPLDIISAFLPKGK